MKTKHTIESQLYCRSTAELNDSVESDLEKSDGSLKELLNDRSSINENESVDRSTSELSKE